MGKTLFGFVFRSSKFCYFTKDRFHSHDLALFPSIVRPLGTQGFAAFHFGYPHLMRRLHMASPALTRLLRRVGCMWLVWSG